jgi:hypothetical protein
MANHFRGHIHGSRQLEISGDEVAIEEYERGNCHCAPFREDTSYLLIHRDSRRRLWHADTRSSRDPNKRLTPHRRWGFDISIVWNASNKEAIGDVMQAAWRAARPSCGSVSHQALPDDFRHRAEEEAAGATAPTR